MKLDVKLKSADKFFSELKKVEQQVKGPVVKVGILSGATTDEGQNVAQYAVYNEFGTEHIPARPFMRRTVETKSERWNKIAEAAMRNRVIDPDMVHTVLQTVGLAAASDVQETIASNMAPPNSPKTMERKTKGIKGAGKGEPKTHVPGTLIDTGTMIKAISHRVED